MVWLHGDNHRKWKFQPHLQNEQECLHYNEILDEETVPDTWEEEGAWSIYLKKIGMWTGINKGKRKHIVLNKIDQ